MFVAPGRTGLGIGRRLLTELLAACADAGLRQVIAVIADSGDQASVPCIWPAGSVTPAG